MLDTAEAKRKTFCQRKKLCGHSLGLCCSIHTFWSLRKHARKPLYADLQLDIPDSQDLVL